MIILFTIIITALITSAIWYFFTREKETAYFDLENGKWIEKRRKNK